LGPSILAVFKRCQIGLGVALARKNYIGFTVRRVGDEMHFDAAGQMDSAELDILADVVVTLADEVGGSEIPREMEAEIGD